MTKSFTQILGCRFPIVQGPMLWLTDATFVAAVSNAGALGVLGFNAGQTEPTKSLTEILERTKNEIRKVKTLTDNPFGLNLALAPDPDKDPFSGPTIDLMIEEQVPVAVVVGPVIPHWFNKLKSNGIKIIYRALTPTITNTKQAVAAGADVIVATGFDEGGTVPTKVVGTFTILPMIVDAAGDIPVLACGGIADTRAVRASFALGASGIFIGTALLAAEESRLASNIKQQLILLNADDMLLYRADPAFYRSIPGKLPNHLVAMNAQGATGTEIFAAADRYNGMREGMLFGNLDKGYASFGLGISQIHAIEPAQKIIARLATGIPEHVKN